jgi:hypothetical protein
MGPPPAPSRRPWCVYLIVCHAAHHYVRSSIRYIQMETDGQESDDEDWERVGNVSASSPEVLNAQPTPGANVGEWFIERSKYIPLRLTLIERKYLRLLDAALSVSEYTDKIDTIGFNLAKPKRIVQQIKELCAILSGLYLSSDYKGGQELFESRDFKANASFYQRIFELGRRHKIMNPEKMRSTYGKLIYMLQVFLLLCHSTHYSEPVTRTVRIWKSKTSSASPASGP